MKKMSESKFNTIDKEAQVAKFKRSLDNWREMALLAQSVLLWKKNYHPWTLAAVITLVFMQFAYYELSLVSSVSVLVMFFTLVDFLGPMCCSALYKAEDWTAAKEKEFEDLCKSLASFSTAFNHYYKNLLEVKATRPNLYFPVLLTSLSLCAWIGNSINNMFLTYIICLTLLLLPGIVHNGFLNKTIAMARARVAGLISSDKTKTQ